MALPPLQPCPPGPTVTSFDLSACGSCRALLSNLFQAYTQALTGNQRIRVRVGDRWTDYSRANVPELLATYRMLFTECVASGVDMSGLPSLNPGNRARRGAAVFQFRGPIGRL